MYNESRAQSNNLDYLIILLLLDYLNALTAGISFLQPNNKKNIEPIFGKVIEGDEIKKTLDIFLEKLLEATR